MSLRRFAVIVSTFAIGVALFAEQPAPGVDTADDLAWADRTLTRQLKEVSP